jgi:hypothetical protein
MSTRYWRLAGAVDVVLDGESGRLPWYKVSKRSVEEGVYTYPDVILKSRRNTTMRNIVNYVYVF